MGIPLLRRLTRLLAPISVVPQSGPWFRPELELLEKRNLFAVSLTVPDTNINISALNDNQAEPTIAVNPTNPSNVFARP